VAILYQERQTPEATGSSMPENIHTVKTTAQGFDDIREALNSASAIGATAGIKLGQVSKSRDAKAFNAAVTISLDKHYYASFLGRDMDYVNIPLSGRMVMNHVREVVLDMFAESFARQSSPDGHKWQDITKGTQRWRKSKGYNPDGPILIASGNLAMAVNAWAESHDTLENYSVVGANSRLVIDISEIPSSEQQKAYVHNIGGPWGKGGSLIPARPFMTSDTTDLDAGGRKRVRDAAREGWQEYLSYLDHPERVKLGPGRRKK
jgi:phage gpG-like protein